MAERLPDDFPATLLFPQFESELYNMVASEVEGLTDAQLDFESDRWEWSRWSIRRNVSHVASGDFRWLLVRWGQQLFPQGLPEVEDLESLTESPHDRRLDEGKYWRMEDILGKVRQGLGLCWSVLSEETVGSLKAKQLEIENTDLWSLFSQAHPSGIHPVPNDPSLIYLSLEATMRHRWFEYTTHLYNVQRLKRAQGLSARAEIPFEGYFALLGWDRSEP